MFDSQFYRFWQQCTSVVVNMVLSMARRILPVFSQMRKKGGSLSKFLPQSKICKSTSQRRVKSAFSGMGNGCQNRTIWNLEHSIQQLKYASQSGQRTFSTRCLQYVKHNELIVGGGKKEEKSEKYQRQPPPKKNAR